MKLSGGNRSLPVLNKLQTGRSVYVTDLEPSTRYFITVRPANIRGDVIEGIVGKLSVTTRKR